MPRRELRNFPSIMLPSRGRLSSCDTTATQERVCSTFDSHDLPISLPDQQHDIQTSDPS
jgi:hypothetical protein